MNNYKIYLSQNQSDKTQQQTTNDITRAVSKIICTTRHHIAVKFRPDCSQSSPYGTQLKYRLSETG